MIIVLVRASTLMLLRAERPALDHVRELKGLGVGDALGQRAARPPLLLLLQLAAVGLFLLQVGQARCG
jgi:hypothetical protein